MRKILVTGGLGVVGRHLVRILRERENEVWSIDLSHNHDSQYIKCDITSFMQLQRELRKHKFKFVYHLAAEFGRWNGEDYYDSLWKANVIGTKNIIRLQEELGFKMIFSSSSEVYGDYDGVMIEEVMDKYEIKQLNDYAMTKWVNEMQIMNSAKMFNTKTVRVRLFNTYGPGEYYSSYRSVCCLFVYKALHKMPYTVYLGHHRTSSFITDTVKTLANIVDNFISGSVYNIASEEYHNIKTLSDLILDRIGINDDLVTYKVSEPFTTHDKKVDASKAKIELNHKPMIPLKEGIHHTVEWMRETYKI